jgi:hypothetical protein
VLGLALSRRRPGNIPAAAGVYIGDVGAKGNLVCAPTFLAGTKLFLVWVVLAGSVIAGTAS